MKDIPASCRTPTKCSERTTATSPFTPTRALVGIISPQVLSPAGLDIELLTTRDLVPKYLQLLALVILPSSPTALSMLNIDQYLEPLAPIIISATALAPTAVPILKY
jgi:hypothetical protein